MRRGTNLLAVLLAIFLLPSEAAAQVASDPDAATLYADLREVSFDAARAVTIADVSLQRGPAVFYFERGVWIPLQAVTGRVTGAVFLGDGEILLEPPPGVEQDQLFKFSGERTLAAELTALYLRFTDDTAPQIAGMAIAEGQAADIDRARDLHQELREELLEDQGMNLEARILTDLAHGGGERFYAWIETREHGRLTLRIDPTAADRYTLAHWNDRFGGRLDTWSAFGPGAIDPALPEHYTIDVTLEGENLVEARAALRLRAMQPGQSVVRFDTSSLLEIREVLDADGNRLFFAREQIGRNEWEPAITVGFPSPLPTDEDTTVTFVYGGDIIDTASSGGFGIKAPVGWYPMLGYLKRATFDLVFRVEEDRQVLASGELIADAVTEGVRVVRFRQEIPVKLASFNYGSMSIETVEIDGAPPITVFGRALGPGGASRMRNIGIDVGNSLNYFSQMFGPYPFPYMYATRIPYPHGQGFPGLLHLAAGTFERAFKGSTEAFRGHEVAHQWWGHIVGWESYRDQWLSEGFAMYSGALYAAMYYQEDEILERMTNAWRNDILGTGNVRALLGFDRYGLTPGMMRYSQGSRSGPISIGRRLASGETPVDYQILVYEKGGFVLHMLRMLFYDFGAGNDEPFRAMMRDFVATHRGGEATTEDFRRVVERHAGGDMGWFFDQWVDGTGIPTYRYAWTTERTDDGAIRLKVRVRQSVDPEGLFDMPVLLRAEFGDDPSRVVRIRVSQAEEVFEFSLPREPTDIVLNHANSVLAEVVEEDW